MASSSPCDCAVCTGGPEPLMVVQEEVGGSYQVHTYELSNHLFDSFARESLARLRFASVPLAFGSEEECDRRGLALFGPKSTALVEATALRRGCVPPADAARPHAVLSSSENAAAVLVQAVDRPAVAFAGRGIPAPVVGSQSGGPILLPVTDATVKHGAKWGTGNLQAGVSFLVLLPLHKSAFAVTPFLQEEGEGCAEDFGHLLLQASMEGDRLGLSRDGAFCHLLFLLHVVAAVLGLDTASSFTSLLEKHAGAAAKAVSAACAMPSLVVPPLRVTEPSPFPHLPSLRASVARAVEALKTPLSTPLC